MTRVSLIEENDHPELAPLIERLRSGRRGALIDLYRVLLHSPDVAAAWFEYANAVRWKTGLDGRLRELVIVRIATLYGVDYMLRQHVPGLTMPEGIGAEECAALADWRPSRFFSDRERAALAYADAMSRDVTVSDDVYGEVARHFGEAQIVELTLLIGAFYMSTRVMKALELTPQPLPPQPAATPAKRAAPSGPPVVVVEDDWFTRLYEVALDPDVSAERVAAFADFFAHDEPDFAGWCARVRARAAGLHPAKVKLAGSVEEMRQLLPGASALLVESFPVGRAELEAGRDLVVIQKFGALPRGIDVAACAERGIRLLTVRRRSTAACAEFAITLMLMLARKLQRLAGRISAAQLVEDGGPYRPFDRRHTANSNWARVPGLRTLNGSTFGIIGVGEIGREIVLRLANFGMRLTYHQRTRLPAAEERALRLTYVPLDRLIAESDWIVPLLPISPSTRRFFDRARFAQMKPGAFLINISRAELVDRDALIEALDSGRLGGFALDPLYEEPGRDDDELLRFRNVILTPHIAAQPRFNVLNEMSDMMAEMAGELAR
jgi:phosphoglycerate dehydrogenase-like enzyme/alkylhydroperoxidase family enzyme